MTTIPAVTGDMIDRGETVCQHCGDIVSVLDGHDTDDYGHLCSDCWEVAADADPTLWWEI